MPGQRFAVAAMEVCSRILDRQNDITARRVPVHHGITGNEKADKYAKAAAEENPLCEEVPDEYRWETSLLHMTRAAAEARSRSTGEWISSHIRAERRYKPPPRMRL